MAQWRVKLYLQTKTVNSMEKYNLTPKQEEDMVNGAYKVLRDGYLASNHRKKVDIIDRAFRFACEAHKGVRRRSGEP